MRARKITQAQLGAAIGVSQAAVYKWLNNSMPAADSIVKLARFLETTPEALLETSAPQPNIDRENDEHDLTFISEYVNNLDVTPKLPSLLKRLNEATAKRGKKSELAKFLGVSLVQVSQWLTGDREPGGETTLRLLHWVDQQERQK